MNSVIKNSQLESNSGVVDVYPNDKFYACIFKIWLDRRGLANPNLVVAKDYGLISPCVRTLNMDTQHLEENLRFLLEDIDTMRPKRECHFITRMLLRSPPNP
uniref:Uncharacterized protein n=1 Tax=Glossina brevipalpis TaxID=37001 RepID=A0A1A9WPR6_9MUSC